MSWTLAAPAAYRADIAQRSEPFGEHDDTWIAVVSILQHATLVPSPSREELLQSAIDLARQTVGDEGVDRLNRTEWERRDGTPSDAIVLLSDLAQQSGAFNIGAALLDALIEAEPTRSPVQRGRVMARRARIASRMGALDEAAARYAAVNRLGASAKCEELQARASSGLSNVALMKGNYPQVTAHAKRALRLARGAGLPFIECQVRHNLMIVAGEAGQFDSALVQGWAIFQIAAGRPLEEAQVVQNLGQLLLKAGHAAESRAAFAFIVSQELPARFILPALGGLALASAGVKDLATVDWAVREVASVNIATAPQHAMASTLLECARALLVVGRISDSIRYQDSALDLAQRYRFHEIVFRVEALVEPEVEKSPKQPLGARGTSIAREVAWMEPPRLPDHVLIATAAV